MSGPKHTPGPWNLYGHYTITSMHFDIADAALQQAHMAPGEAQANARLIAAAPAMADLLRMVGTIPSLKPKYREQIVAVLTAAGVLS